MANFNWPINPTTVNSGPVQYEVDGIPTTVNIDTGTPANSTPLPVRLYDSSGNIVAFAQDYGVSSAAIRAASQIGNSTGEADFGSGVFGAQTLRVVVATDQPSIPVAPSVNSNGTYDEITNLTTVAQTFNVPANAVGFIIEALSANTENIRYKIGAAATTTSGMRLEPGRSEGFVPCAANISVIAEGGSNQVVSVQWVLSA